MVTGRPDLYSTTRKFIIVVLLLSASISCTIIKNYPSNKPFVYKTNIRVSGNFSNDSVELLQSRLKGQLDDSMKSRAVSKIFWSVMKNPPVYDPANADKSILYMRALLVSLGYFKDSINYKAVIDTAEKNQYRTTIDYEVKPGKPVRLDSISFNIKKPELQQLTISHLNKSLLKKGEPFAKATISQELDRLTLLYRNNGHLRFGRDLLQGLWDTVDVSLLKPGIDPLEQLEILQKLRERRLNPTADLEIRLKPGIDTNRLNRYFIGNISVYPDFDLGGDTTNYKQAVADEINVFYHQELFKPKIFPPYIYLYHDSLYKQGNYIKTINRFNSLGSWRLVTIDQLPRKGQDTADFIIRLTAAKKYSFTTNLEGSLNNSAVSGNLAGFSINAVLQNRNVWKAANQSSSSIRFGVETGGDTTTKVKFVQTKQLSFSHSVYFPRLVFVNNLFSKKIRENSSTSLSFNAATTERRNLFNLSTINASWGYKFDWNKSSLSIRIPNFEYSLLKPKPLLKDTLFVNNPGLRYIFTDGFISSIIATYTRSGGKKKNINFFRANIESSGLMAGLFKSKFLDSNLYRFIKFDAEFTRKIFFGKSALALRMFAGFGYEFESTADTLKRNNLPFFKQYFAGGPNSMRAWALRKLGPGSSIKSFDLDPQRYGDVQLEANIEYRYPIAVITGVKLNGAVFADIGNIWFMKKTETRPPEEIFNLNRFGKDIAIGLGTGLRVDFGFLKLRLDYSYKAKDPSPDKKEAQNKWFYKAELFNGQFQLGISYPFIL
jgi:outer membrane protein assembly factor BamA